MASELKDRLTDLVDHTPSGTPPPDLWSRGVRRRRIGQAATSVLVAALVLVLGAGGLAWRADRAVEPASPQGQATFPDRFFAPSPWLHTFSRPPGQLVAILPAERKSLLHTHQGVVGITARGNVYGFLDLPSSAIASSGSDAGLAVSPQGSRVAFWVTGPTAGRPNTLMNGGQVVTGVGTYDTVTGQTLVHQVPSAHGLEPSLLTWTDDSTLVFGFGRIHNDGTDGTSHATYTGTYVWSADASEPSELPTDVLPPYPDAWSSGAAHGMLLTSGYQRRWWLLDPLAPQTVRRFAVRSRARMPVLSPDLREIGAVEQHAVDEGYYWLLAANIPARTSAGAAVFHRVPVGKQWFATVGWAGNDDLVALRRLTGVRQVSTGDVMAELDRVQVATGTYTRLADVEEGANVADPYSELVATSYLDAPVVKATAPDSPWGERWVALLGALGAAVTFLLWRRRGRRA